MFVIVHGAFGGGWQWRRVAAMLRSTGHEVFTPTLTGLGERVHLATPDIGLDTHSEDIVNVFRFEDLHDVVLVGHSYGGLVITAVAERIPERIAQLVYLDALVPEDGQCHMDMLGPEITAAFLEIARQYGDGWRVPHDPPDEPFYTDHPIKPSGDVLHLTNPRARTLPHTFIECTEERDPNDVGLLPIIRSATRARQDPAWRYYTLPTGHLPCQTLPEATAELLVQISAASAGVRAVPEMAGAMA